MRLIFRNSELFHTTDKVHFHCTLAPLSLPKGPIVWSNSGMVELRAEVTATAAEIDGEPAIRLEIVVPADQMVALLDLVVTTVLAAKGLTE